MPNHIKTVYNLCEMESRDTESQQKKNDFRKEIKIVFYSIENSINEEAKNFGFERKSIRKWRKRLLILTKVSGYLRPKLYTNEKTKKI